MKLLHIGIHNSANKNSGDTLLFKSVRDLFDLYFENIEWGYHQLWEDLNDTQINAINKDFDGIILGGGGLLLKDQKGSIIDKSGWQWNCSEDSLKKINIPLIIFAIGYNRFRGQEEFDDIFYEHISAVVDKASFVGLRNNGSIQALKNYIPDNLHNKLTKQACPTTLLAYIHKESFKIKESNKNRKLLAFNAAFDRSSHRFGSNKEDLLRILAASVKSAQDMGWKIDLVAHKYQDLEIEKSLLDVDLDYEIRDLTDSEPEAIIEYYSNVDFVFGMRGHAQMIPFGLGKPILSIISHDKMKFFLEDIDHLDWGVEIEDEKIEQQLIRSLKFYESNKEKIFTDLNFAQENIRKETAENMDNIKTHLNRTKSNA